MMYPKLTKTVAAKVRQIFAGDPLLRPLGRTPDSVINQYLARRGMGRADLFRGTKTLAPHRYRIAAMLAAHKLSAREVAARCWPALKRADHICAHCADTKRCDRWMHQPAPEDAPRTFCPNATTFEQWQRDKCSGTADGAVADGETLLEGGLEQTRALLRQQSGPTPAAGLGWRRYP